MVADENGSQHSLTPNAMRQVRSGMRFSAVGKHAPWQGL